MSTDVQSEFVTNMDLCSLIDAVDITQPLSLGHYWVPFDLKISHLNRDGVACKCFLNQNVIKS